MQRTELNNLTGTRDRSTDFEPLYKQSRLPDDIVELLPKSTRAAPAGYLAGVSVGSPKRLLQYSCLICVRLQCLLNGIFIV